MKTPLILSLGLLLTGCGQLTMLDTLGSTEGTRQLASQARAGDAESAYRLGLQYTQGADLPQNYAQGLYYFRQAAVEGHVDAAYMFAMGHYLGRGTRVDYQQARTWFEYAASRGHPGAMQALGELFYNGYGTPRAPFWGVRWLAAAADQGAAGAQYLLGVSYLTGIGTVKDSAAGLAWLKRAADVGDLRAQQLLEGLAVDLQRLQPAIMQVRSAQYHEVIYLQRRLQAMGFAPGPVDGLWGPATQRAVALKTGKTLEIQAAVRALREIPETP